MTSQFVVVDFLAASYVLGIHITPEASSAIDIHATVLGVDSTLIPSVFIVIVIGIIVLNVEIHTTAHEAENDGCNPLDIVDPPLSLDELILPLQALLHLRRQR